LLHVLQVVETGAFFSNAHALEADELLVLEGWSYLTGVRPKQATDYFQTSTLGFVAELPPSYYSAHVFICGSN